MAPQPVTSPDRRFVITQTVGGTETNVAVGTLMPNNYTSDQAQRTIVLSNAAQLKLANPAVLYKVYSPSNGGAHADGDCVWRSDIDYGGTG